MKKLCNRMLLTIGLGGLIVCFALGIFLINHQAMIVQKNAIGVLYLEEKERSKDYLYAVFENVSDENLKAAEVALEEYGFTNQGMQYLGNKMRLAECCMPVFLVAAVMFVIILYALYQRKQMWYLEKQALEAKISELEQTRMQDDYVKEQNRRIQNFIENMAHQIKTPISRVFSSLYIIEDVLEEPEKKDRIHECYAHLDSINLLMKRLMDIGRLEAGKVIFKKEKINLDELMEDVVRSSCENVERVNIIFETDMEMTYYGDYELLREAFMNITINAFEHDKSGKPLQIVCACDGEQLRVTVRDHGPGLSEKDIPNLFDRFYTPETMKATHTGIGLNLAKLIFEGHFGSIYVSNHAEGGAVFHVILPLYSLKVGKVEA